MNGDPFFTMIPIIIYYPSTSFRLALSSTVSLRFSGNDNNKVQPTLNQYKLVYMFSLVTIQISSSIKEPLFGYILCGHCERKKRLSNDQQTYFWFSLWFVYVFVLNGEFLKSPSSPLSSNVCLTSTQMMVPSLASSPNQLVHWAI